MCCSHTCQFSVIAALPPPFLLPPLPSSPPSLPCPFLALPLPLSFLHQENLSSRSFMSGSPRLRAWWGRHFSVELKTSGDSISSQSWHCSADSCTTCHTSL